MREHWPWKSDLTALIVLALGLTASLLTGCGSSNFSTTVPSPPPAIPPAPPATTPPAPPPVGTFAGPAFTVKVMAGGTPLVGATVRLYAAGATGLGSAGSILATGTATDEKGFSNVSAPYRCAASTSLTYLIASGGKVGTSGAGNDTIALMTALGPCAGLAAGAAGQAAGPYVINEVTSVGAMYALSPFYANGAFGATAMNLTGFTNAFATAATLANALTGQSPGAGLPANASNPAARVNTVANALNACVVHANSCAGLYAQAPGGIPADTLDALFDLTAYPAKQPGAVYTESLLSTAYAPALTSVPLDWTLSLQLSGGGLHNPTALKVDSSGSVWVANYYSTASKFSPVGEPVFANGITGLGLNNSFSLAIDANDNVFIANEQPYINSVTTGSVTALTSGGASLSGPAGFQAGGLNYPISIALDPNGTIWVMDNANSHVTLLDHTGNPLSGSTGYTSPLFAFPESIAIDGNHFGWIGNTSGYAVTKVAPDGSSFVNYLCCHDAAGIAIDAGNNVWVANYVGNSVSLISSAGVVVSNGTYTGADSLNHPQGIVVDGRGDIFVANYRAGYLTKLAGSAAVSPGAALSPATGLGGDAKLLEAYGLAIDASGNVWVSNNGNATVTKFIGLAAPVKTPALGLPAAP